MTAQQEGFGFLKTKYTSPRAPFQSSSDTSVEAAERIEGHISKQEGRVLEAYRAHGRAGATQEQIEDATGLKSGSVSARTNALVAADRPGGRLLIKTDRERFTRGGRPAAVYVTPENDR